MTIPKRDKPRRDNGLFGPGSLTWEIHGHPTWLIAAGRSAYYTALSSEVAQSVCDHSIFFDDPLTRTQETAYWAYTSVFGDTDEARRAGKWLQGMHSKVKGHDPVSHRDYSPSRPDLAVTAHGLIWESALIAYESFVRQLSTAERETYWREGFLVAELLDIDPATLPPTYPDWREYYNTQIVPTLNYSAAGNRIVMSTKRADYAPSWARPLIKAMLVFFEELTLATMPTTERELVGHPRSGPRTELTRRIGSLIATVATTSPLRDQLERSLGGHVHELLTEARAAQRDHSKQALAASR